VSAERLRAAPPGRAWESPAFAVGGTTHFTLRACPGGDGAEGSGGHLSLALVLRTPSVRLVLDAELCALDQVSGLPAVREAARGCVLGSDGGGEACLELAFPRFLSHSRAASFKDELLPGGSLILTATVSVTSASGDPAAVAGLHPRPSPRLVRPSAAAAPAAEAAAPAEAEAAGALASELARLTPVPPKTIGADLAALLASADGSDVRLVLVGAGGEDAPPATAAAPPAFRAHRALLAARSPAFRSLLAGGKAQLEIAGCDARTFSALLHFIYADELEAPPPRALAATLLAAATRFQLPRLVALCSHALASGMGCGDAAALLLLADRERAGALRRAALAYITANAEAVRASAGWERLRGAHPRLHADAERAMEGGAAAARAPEPVPGLATMRFAAELEKASSGPTLYLPPAKAAERRRGAAR